jgi:hypothetical protein
MNFKFLKDLSAEEAGLFFQSLLWKLGDSMNDGDFIRIVDHIIEAQTQGYSDPGRFIYEVPLLHGSINPFLSSA